MKNTHSDTHTHTNTYFDLTIDYSEKPLVRRMKIYFINDVGEHYMVYVPLKINIPIL